MTGSPPYLPPRCLPAASPLPPRCLPAASPLPPCCLPAASPLPPLQEVVTTFISLAVLNDERLVDQGLQVGAGRRAASGAGPWGCRLGPVELFRMYASLGYPKLAVLPWDEGSLRVSVTCWLALCTAPTCAPPYTRAHTHTHTLGGLSFCFLTHTHTHTHTHKRSPCDPFPKCFPNTRRALHTRRW